MAVVAEKVGNRIEVSSPWYPEAPQHAKAVPGYKWNKTKKVWTYPLSMITCRKLRKVYEDRLEIGPDLWAWAAAEGARERSLATLGAQDTGTLTVVPRVSPGLAEAMATRPYQIAGARFAATARAAGIFDDPGLGKTAMSLAAIMEAEEWRDGSRHLVIAPKTAVQATWPGEIAKWAPEAKVFAMTMDGKPKRDKVLDEFLAQSGTGVNFLVIHPNMLQVKVVDFCKKCKMWEPDLEKPENHIIFATHYGEGHKLTGEIFKMDYPQLFSVMFDSIIADECHKYMLKLRPGSKKIPQWAEGLKRLNTKDGGLRMPMTGTPFRGKESSMFGILHWLDSKAFSSYWHFVDAFLEKSDNGYGVDVGGLREDAAKEFDILMSRHTLRRRKSEVRTELPEQNLHDHWVTLEGKHKKQYEEFSTLGTAALDSGSLETVGVLAELTRLRQLSFGVWDMADGTKLHATPESPKIELLLDMLEERGLDTGPEAGPKFIVASQWNEVLDAVAAGLESGFKGLHVLRLDGRVTGDKRQKVVKSFQEDPHGPRVMLLNTKAGGESITLDRYCDEMFIMDETWVDDDIVQLRGRIDNRAGDIRPRFYHYIRTKDTIEEEIANLNMSQAEVQATLLDRRRGVEVARRLLGVK